MDDIDASAMPARLLAGMGDSNSLIINADILVELVDEASDCSPCDRLGRVGIFQLWGMAISAGRKF